MGIANIGDNLHSDDYTLCVSIKKYFPFAVEVSKIPDRVWLERVLRTQSPFSTEYKDKLSYRIVHKNALDHQDEFGWFNGPAYIFLLNSEDWETVIIGLAGLIVDITPFPNHI